jgi:urea transport system substrate-binding protein
VVGGSNVAFYKQLKAAGITGDKQLLLTLSVTEDEMPASAARTSPASTRR